MKTRLLLIISMLTFCFEARAQLDPALAGMIVAFTEKAKSEYKTQNAVMLTISTGHIWTKEEVNSVYDLQKEYNTYLDSFRGIVIYAAQIYGFYHEISKLTDNLNSYARQLDKHPGNALAVALSSRRNQLYRDVIMQSVDIVNDIRQVCMGKSKMTEKERMEIVFSIRPKLKAINRKIQLLTKMVRYTSLDDIWGELTDRAYHKSDKASIVNECYGRWRRSAKQ